MDTKYFLKKFPDLRVQMADTVHVEPRKSVEEKVMKIVEVMGTGLVWYYYSNRRITIYTSMKMKEWLQQVKVGGMLVDPNTGKQCTVISEPYILCGSLCIGVDFSGYPEAYDCSYFIKP